MVNSVNRLNQIFERDLGISLQLISNTDELIFLNPNTDPYESNFNGEVQNLLTNTIGESNYDVGHVFIQSIRTFGSAGCIACVCSNGRKGSAFTAHIDPGSDDMNLIAAHEFGHQFGAYHTQSNASCRTAINTSEVEPGSGSTIMSYAGICDPNVELNPDDYFNYTSIRDIAVWSIDNSNCAEIINNNNTPPTVNAGLNYIIPASTTFVLEAEANDSYNSNALTYCWEQNDPENPNSNNTPSTIREFGPMFRSFSPSSSPKRYFPSLSDVVSNNLTPTWEVLPSISRELNFVVTARDNDPNGGQTVSDFTRVTVDANAGPFSVISQSTTNEIWTVDDFVNVTWDVANTNIAPINTDSVEIYLSTDGGLTFPTSLITTPNDGEETFLLPNTIESTNEARILIKGVNNIFFAVNSQNFTIEKSEYVLNTEQEETNICNPEDLSLEVEYKTFLSFSEEVSLSLNNLPTGVDGVLSTNVFSGLHTTGTKFTVSLTGTSSLTAGKYDFNIVGNSVSNIEKTITITFTVFSSDQTDIILTTPSNFSTTQEIDTEFTWENNENSVSYLIEIATDDSFTSIADSAEIETNSYFSNLLVYNQKYYWRVRSTNPCGTSNFSPPYEFTTKCSIPTDFISTQTLLNSISLSWNDTPSNNSWTVEYGLAGFTVGTGNTIVTNEKTTTINGLKSGSLYNFYLRSNCSDIGIDSLVGPLSVSTQADYCNGDHFYDTGGEFRNYSNNENITTTINPSSTDQVVQIRFLSFDLEDTFDFLSIYNGQNTTDLLGVFSGTELLNKRFTSTDSSGALTFVFTSDPSISRSGWDAIVSCINKPNCLAPSDFRTINISSKNVELAWNQNDSQANEWTIEYGTTGFTIGTGTEVILSNLNQTLVGLTPETEYQAYIKANCTLGGFSDITGPISFRTLVACEIPDNFSFVSSTTESAELSWENTTNATEWEIQYSIADFTPGTGTNITTNTNSITLENLVSNTKYYAYVRANCDTDGFSGWSNKISFNTQLDYCNGDHFYDTGGEFGDYLNNENTITTISPNTDTDRVRVTFNSFALELGFDFLNVYDGESINDTLLGRFTGGELSNTELISTHNSGALTFVFISDGVVSDSGWDATVICEPKPNCIALSDFRTTNISSKNVELIWNQNDSQANEWTIEYGTTGFTIGTGTEVILSNLNQTLIGLTPEAEYQAYIKANCTLGGFSDITGPISFRTLAACEIPDNFSFVSSTLESAELSWENTTNATEWEIQYSIADFTPGTGTSITTNINSITLENLASNTKYYAYVRANCDTDGFSGWSNRISFNTQADYCNGDHFYDTGGEFGDYLNNENTITTIFPDTNTDRVRVIFNSFLVETCCDGLLIFDGPDDQSPLIGTFTQNPGSISSTHETGALTFLFQSDGSITSNGWDATVICEPKPNCIAPSDFRTTNISSKNVELAWNQNDSQANEWTIEYGTTGFTIGTGTEVILSNLNQTLIGLTPEAEYQAYIKANCTLGGFSDITGPISFRTLAACEIPDNFSFVSSTTKSAELSWENTTNATEWEIQYGIADFTPGTGTSITTNTNSITLENLASNTKYYAYVRANCDTDGFSGWSNRISFNTQADYCNGDHFYDTGGEFGNYLNDENTITTISPNTDTDRVRVIFNSFLVETCCDGLLIFDGPDDQSPLIGIFTQNPGSISSTHETGALTFLFQSDGSITSNGWDATVICEPKPNCIAPSDFRTTNISSKNVELAWNQNDSQANEWTIEYGTTGFTIGTGTEVILSNLNQTLIGLTPETEYQAYIKANCTLGGFSEITGPISFRTLVACEIPDNFSFVSSTLESAELSWENTTNATEWEIQYSIADFTPGTGTSITTNTNSITLENLVSNTKYYAYVRTNCDTDGFSGWSNKISFNTQLDYCNGDHFYDTGGEFGDYSNDENTITTISPNTDTDRVRVTFNSFALELGFDFLNVYDGESINDTLLGRFTGRELSNTELISTHNSGALTFVFTSDGIINDRGWDATVICEPKLNCNAPTNFENTSVTESTASFQWEQVGSENEFVLEYGLQGFPQNTGITLLATSNSIEIGTLEASISYDIYIRTNCHTEGNSDIVGPLNFTTACILSSTLDNLIVNGSFECGNSNGWVISGDDDTSGCGKNFVVQENSQNICSLVDQVTPTDGDFAAFTSFDGFANTNYTISQSFSIPDNLDNISSIILSFDFKMNYDFSIGAVANLERVFTAKIIEENNNLNQFTVTELKFGAIPNISSKIDLTITENIVDQLWAFTGKQVKLEFNAFVPESSTGPSKALLDNVSLIVNEENTLSIPITQINDPKRDLLIYPNPSRGDFYISYKSSIKLLKMEIYDLKGRLIKTNFLRSDIDTIKVNTDLAAGVYFLIIHTKSNTITRRLVIR